MSLKDSRDRETDGECNRDTDAPCAGTLEAQDDTIQAIIALKRALSLAEPEGYVRTFIDEGLPIAKLLEKILNEKKTNHTYGKVDFSQSYIQKLLSALKLSALAKTHGGLVEPLSKRESEVLQLMAGKLSNRDIAQELFISLNTVKTHIRNINSKMNVHNRTEAATRAKELGLL